MSLSGSLWKEKDLLTGAEWEESSAQPGYLYQILVTLADGQGNETLWEQREIRVQVQGAGELAGMDNGNLADVTAFSSETRETFAGKMAVYVRRIGPGSIQVFLELADGKEKEYFSPVYGTAVLL